MKYALILGLVLVVFWLWRSARQAQVITKNQANARKTPASLEKVTEIVACRVCQVHLPRNDSISGAHGSYCSAEHRQQAGDRA